MPCEAPPEKTDIADEPISRNTTPQQLKKLEQLSAENIGKYDSISRVFVRPSLGEVKVPEAYAIAALLGDGCSRQGGKKLHISSADDKIPEKLSQILNQFYFYKIVQNLL